MSRKVTKESVDYREAKGSKRCGNCSMYSGNGHGSCTRVQGLIYAKDFCDDWARQEKKHWEE